MPPKRTRKPKTTPAKSARKRATRRAARSRRAPASKLRTQTQWQLDEKTIEAALLTGEASEPLQDYFGPENYRELRQLSRDVAARGVRGGPRVLILPGIMGSQIGEPAFLLPDVYWFDPVDIAQGRLTSLALNGDAGRFAAVGVMLLFYLKLKLRLRAAGFDAVFHAFDWRRSIADLGKELADRLKKEGKDVSLVAHSMGGLVARWALGAGKAECKRLIMLGTPNFGAWAPVMAMRAAYPVVRKVAALDLSNSPEDLARKVFSTFPGLIQMFPAKEKQGEYDVHDLAKWPNDQLRPVPKLLAGIDAVRSGYLDRADNLFMIAGVDQETPVGVEPVFESKSSKRPKEFSYKLSHEGDGTVPLALALLPGAKRTYYVREKHGDLPNNKTVAQAVRDLLQRDETDVLPTTYVPAGGARGSRTITAAELFKDPYEGRRGRAISSSELRQVMEEFAAPDVADSATAGAPADLPSITLTPGAALHDEGYRHRFEKVVVGRRRQHRIDLRFARGSITEVDTRAIALGIFRDVAPRGAAAAINQRLGGAVLDLTRRRMFSGNLGEIFVLPTGRHALTADFVTFVGLGDFDRFQDEALQTAAENLIRTFVRSRVEEFGTVVFGGASGESPAAGLRNMLEGFVRGLVDADTDHSFRRIVVCENDPVRYQQLKEELFRLSSTTLCQDVELTFEDVDLPPEPVMAALPEARALPTKAPIYLTVRFEPNGQKNKWNVRTSLLTAGDKATVITGVKALDAARLDELRDEASAEGTTSFDRVGSEIASLLLTDEIQAVLPRFHEHHLVLVHDADSSRAPWETLALKRADAGELWYPAKQEGVSHRFAAEKLSVAKWLDERLSDGVLNVLLVVDPTGDLEGAREEGQRVMKLLADQPTCKVDRLQYEAATRPALLRAFASGKYDIVHYAGHAGFAEGDSSQSGLLCHNDVILTGTDLAAVSRLPTLVFFNACESARVRKLRGGRAKKQARELSNRERAQHILKTVSIGEALMRGGVANFLGTYWPVNDAAATSFAAAFYPALLRRESIGLAIQKARAALLKQGNKDWANYIFYGNHDFVLKELGPGA